jgi:hypothetical protein
MPSVFTIEGAEIGEDEGAEERKGERCKTVKNPRTGCEMQLCYVGRDKELGGTRTGWKFMKGSSRCPARKR